MTDRNTIGFDRGVEREWLEVAAWKVAEGSTPAEARAALWQLLEGQVAGVTAQSARGKTATVVSRIWIRPPMEAVTLHKAAISQLRDTNANGRFALHWAMMIGAYSFFRDVAETVGKIGRLHDQVVVGQVVRRTKDAWGDRTTLQPAVQRLIRSMAKWGVLIEQPKRGAYNFAAPLTVTDPAIAAIMMRSLIVRAGHGIRVPDLMRNPALFPFVVDGAAASPRSWPDLKVSRQGDQSDLVEAIA